MSNQSDLLVFTFEQPSVALSTNKAYSMHWSARRRYLADWRLACRIAFQKAAMAGGDLPLVPVVLDYTFTFARNARRDPANYHATTKSLTDELVIAGLVPDDTAEWVSVVEPTLRIADDNLCIVRIRLRGNE